MPTVNFTYPGVYIEEISSGTHAITGVPTSVTAFVGRTLAGPLSEPTDCFGFADYERYFGGLSADYPLAYAVQDFFQNGGDHAIVVRVFHGNGTEVQAATAQFVPLESTSANPNLPTIQAIGPGKFGNSITLAFDKLGLFTIADTPASVTLTLSQAAGAALSGPAAFTIAPATSAGGSPIALNYATQTGDTVDVVAQNLVNQFNASTNAGSFAPAQTLVSTPTLAAIRFETQAVGSAAMGTANQPTWTAAAAPAGATLSINNAPSTATGTFATGATATGVQATNTLTVAVSGTPTAGTIQYQGLRPGASPASAVTTAPITISATDTTNSVAQKIAQAFNTAFAVGPNAFIVPATVSTAGVITLTAANAGAAGNSIVFTPIGAAPSGVTLTPATPVTLAGGVDPGYDDTPAMTVGQKFEQYGVSPDDLFNLTVTYTPPGGAAPVVERYTSVSLTGQHSPTRLDRMVNGTSVLVVVPPATVQNWPWLPFPAGVVFQYPGQNPPPPLMAAGGTDSPPLTPLDFAGDPLAQTGMYSLQTVDIFNLLCLPPDDPPDVGPMFEVGQDPGLYAAAADFCVSQRAMLLCDPPAAWAGAAQSGRYNMMQPTDVGVTDQTGQQNSAVYFPRIQKEDLLSGTTKSFSPVGSIAGQYAATDKARGVWKAPAGIATGLSGVTALDFKMTDAQDGQINPLGINALRWFNVIGPVIWGARTLRGADVLADDFKYVPARRLTLYIESSLYQGTQWAVFEPNAEPLWSSLRLAVNGFMAPLQQQGAFYGYSVQCDSKTTTAADIQLGVCNIIVAFAPVLPAEFIVLKIQQQTAASYSS